MVTSYDQEMLANKVGQFETAMKELWKEEPESNKDSNSQITHKNEPCNRSSKNEGIKLVP